MPIKRILGNRKYSSLNEHHLLSPLLGMSAREKLLYQEAKQVSDSQLRPFAMEWDEKCIYPRELMKSIAKYGYGGMLAREDIGGKNVGRREWLATVEALATGSTSTAAMITIHNACVSLLDKYAIPEKRLEWVPSLISFNKMVSFCLTEPGNYYFSTLFLD